MTAAVAQTKLLETKKAAVLSPAAGSTKIENVLLSKIVRSPFNREATVTDEFVESIRTYGVMQAVLLRPVTATNDHVTAALPHAPFTFNETVYQLVAGERRWLGSKKAGKETIPAVIRELTDTEAMELQVIENDQRENYNAIDRATAYLNLRNQYMKELKCSEKAALEKVTARVNREIRTVEQTISLKHKLVWQLQAALGNGELEASHAYEIARRTEEEQIKLLAWIRKETQHSQGDVPSVRRLKREIVEMERQADEKRRQETLFKPPQPGTSTTKVPTIEDAVYQGALKLVREVGESIGWVSNPLLQRHLNVGFTLAAALLERMEKENIVGPIFGDDGRRNYIRPKAAPAQTVAKPIVPPTPQPKPLSKAQIKKFAEQQEKAERERLRQQAEFELQERKEKKYQGLFFAALAKKTKINSRFLTHVIPQLLLEAFDAGISTPANAFLTEELEWPAPKGEIYSYGEIERYSKKHFRKYSEGLLGALILSLSFGDQVREQVARYMGVDPKLIRKKADAVVKEEERIARIPKRPEDPKEGVLFDYIQDWDEWKKLRKTGASDKEIREVLCFHFGEYGGRHAPKRPSIVYRGTANNPRVWFKMTDTGKPSLAGAELVAKVRDLMKIPEKGDVDA